MIDFSADSIYTTGTCIEWCGQMPILCLSLTFPCFRDPSLCLLCGSRNEIFNFHFSLIFFFLLQGLYSVHQFNPLALNLTVHI